MHRQSDYDAFFLPSYMLKITTLRRLRAFCIMLLRLQSILPPAIPLSTIQSAY